MTDFFEAFTQLHPASTYSDELRRQATELALQMGSPLTFMQETITLLDGKSAEFLPPLGVAGHVLRSQLWKDFPESTKLQYEPFHRLLHRFLAHYGVEPGWIPPVALFREALALTVERDKYLRKLPPMGSLVGVLTKAELLLVLAAKGFENARDVYEAPAQVLLGLMNHP